jgi:Asp-tRNA(Asn)/Glu-tRNA(Gln) amidotransferase B subunit
MAFENSRISFPPLSAGNIVHSIGIRKIFGILDPSVSEKHGQRQLLASSNRSGTPLEIVSKVLLRHSISVDHSAVSGQNQRC